MGPCAAGQNSKKFQAKITADLRQLFRQYKNTVQFLRASNFFAQKSGELVAIVSKYLEDTKNFPRHDAAMCAVHSTHKLHPKDYRTAKITVEWLVQACLRQNKFVQEFPIEQLTFQESYKHYIQFLYVCSKNSKGVTVPNKMADFMWHSHMQDNAKYKLDTRKMLGYVLNHDDAYPQAKLKQYAKQTQVVAKKLLKQQPKQALKPAAKINVSQAKVVQVNNSYVYGQPSYYHNYYFIDYGPAIFWNADVFYNCDDGNYSHHDQVCNSMGGLSDGCKDNGECAANADCGGNNGGDAGCGANAGCGGNAGCGANAGCGGNGGDASCGGGASCGGSGCGGGGCGGGGCGG